MNARWITKERRLKEYVTPGHPLEIIEARCGECGRELGNAGWPQGPDLNRIETLLLAQGFRYDWNSEIWVTSARARRQIKDFSRKLSADRERWALDQECYGQRPRIELGSDDSHYVDLTALRARGRRYPPGVVGKVESRRYPRWEVALPVVVHCCMCDLANSVDRISPRPETIWRTATAKDNWAGPTRYRPDGSEGNRIRMSRRWVSDQKRQRRPLSRRALKALDDLLMLERSRVGEQRPAPGQELQ